MLARFRPITSTVWSLSRIPTIISTRNLNTIPNMSAITDNDIIARFEKLSLSKPQIYEHAAVANGAQWKAELEKIGKGDVTLTKTVRTHVQAAEGEKRSKLTPTAPIQTKDS